MPISRRNLLVSGAMLPALAGRATTSEPLETAYVNARLWTGVEPGARSSALGLVGNRIAAVGTEMVAQRTGRLTRIIDLQGAFVMPGIIDTHTHFLLGSQALLQPKLRDAATRELFVDRIAEAAKTLEPGRWMQGGGWDHEQWGGELPTRHWIDPVTPHTPVAIARTDLHMLLVNSLALKLAGIDRNTPDVAGGVIVRDEHGDPTGIIKDEAKSLVERAIPRPTDRETEETIAAGVDFALGQGITQVHVTATNWDDHDALRRMRAKGETRIRFYSFVPLKDWERVEALVREQGRGDDWLRWGGLKALVDGSLGSRTARFHEGYSDAPDERGIFVNREADLRAWIASADGAGLHVTTHAIGDEANDLLLDIYADVAATNGSRDRRFRIEHAQHLTDEAIRRIGAQGVVASMQPYHAIDDGRWAEQRIGASRLRGTYAFRSLLAAGAHVSFGSDWPVAPIDPIAGIAAAVLRQTLDGAHPDGWIPEQKVSVEAALHAYTVANAFAGFQEDRLGRLAEGQLADFVVLDSDPLGVDPQKIAGIRVERTVVDGRERFGGEA